jgi:Rhodopirellula transposase DDE domain
VNVGTDHDTAAFAVESVRRWWSARGSADHPGARRLLITADAGGSNGYRTRAWKAGLTHWLAERGVALAATEATGVYWKPVYYALKSLCGVAVQRPSRQEHPGPQDRPVVAYSLMCRMAYGVM